MAAHLLGLREWRAGGSPPSAPEFAAVDVSGLRPYRSDVEEVVRSCRGRVARSDWTELMRAVDEASMMLEDPTVSSGDVLRSIRSEERKRAKGGGGDGGGRREKSTPEYYADWGSGASQSQSQSQRSQMSQFRFSQGQKDLMQTSAAGLEMNSGAEPETKPGTNSDMHVTEAIPKGILIRPGDASAKCQSREPKSVSIQTPTSAMRAKARTPVSPVEQKDAERQGREKRTKWSERGGNTSAGDLSPTSEPQSEIGSDDRGAVAPEERPDDAIHEVRAVTGNNMTTPSVLKTAEKVTPSPLRPNGGNEGSEYPGGRGTKSDIDEIRKRVFREVSSMETGGATEVEPRDSGSSVIGDGVDRNAGVCGGGKEVEMEESSRASHHSSADECQALKLQPSEARDVIKTNVNFKRLRGLGGMEGVVQQGGESFSTDNDVAHGRKDDVNKFIPSESRLEAETKRCDIATQVLCKKKIVLNSDKEMTGGDCKIISPISKSSFATDGGGEDDDDDDDDKWSTQNDGIGSLFTQ